MCCGQRGVCGWKIDESSMRDCVSEKYICTGVNWIYYAMLVRKRMGKVRVYMS